MYKFLLSITLGPNSLKNSDLRAGTLILPSLHIFTTLSWIVVKIDEFHECNVKMPKCRIATSYNVLQENNALELANHSTRCICIN